MQPAIVRGYPQAYGGYPQPLKFCDHSHKSCDTPRMDYEMSVAYAKILLFQQRKA
jgi:hypothetical protein